MQTQQEIFEFLKTALVDLFEVDPAKVTLEAQLYQDLEVDSIDAVDLILRLKEVTGRRIRPEAFKNVRTVGDVVTAVQGVLSAPEEQAPQSAAK